MAQEGAGCGLEHWSHPWSPGVPACPRCGLLDLAVVRQWRAVLAGLSRARLRIRQL